MKRVIAVSDSHGMVSRLRQALWHARERGVIDCAVFLGDGIADWQTVSLELKADNPQIRLYAVRGNNDWTSNAPMAECFTVNGVKFYACHGHQWHVKYGLERLQHAAVEQGARVALFGHTHHSYLASEYGCTFINPGTVCDSGTKSPVYADIRVEEDGRVRADLVKTL